MKVFLLLLMVAGTVAIPDGHPAKRKAAGTGWRGKVSKWLPGPLARRLAFNTATGYDTGKCLKTNPACPAAKKSACTGMGPAVSTDLCTGTDAAGIGFNPALQTARQQLYKWAAEKAAAGQAAEKIFNIAAGETWNQWGEATGCGPSGCANIYTKAMLLYDEANCWPKTKAVPIIVNSRDGKHAEQLTLCANTVKHLLGKKPLGSFLRSPVEQLERAVMHQVMFTCGNTVLVDGVKSKTVPQYPYLPGEGGGGTAFEPQTFAEHTGMCGSWNTDLTAAYKEGGGERFGGTVTTEEYGHTLFDVSIAQYDPEGWHAVARAESAAAAAFAADDATGHERDSDWDCNTAATEYFAAGVEMLLYNVRIGENHKATTRENMKNTTRRFGASLCATMR